MKIWEPKPPGTLLATPGLLRDSFTFYLLLSRDFFQLVVFRFCVLPALTFSQNLASMVRDSPSV